MRWFWIMLGVLLALGAGYIFLRDFIKVKYGPTALKVQTYRCEPTNSQARSSELTFSVGVWGFPEPDSVAVLVEADFHPLASNAPPGTLLVSTAPARIQLRDDGQPPDAAAGDDCWTGIGQASAWSSGRDRPAGLARSVCVVMRRGRQEFSCPVPPLELHRPPLEGKP